MNKITCLVTTYGRFEKLQNLIYCYLNQTFPNKKMIIFNQGKDYYLSDDLLNYNIEVINVGTKIYTDYADVLKDAIKFVDTKYMCFFDDDDIYLPSHLMDLYLGIVNTNCDYVKPNMFFIEMHNKTMLTSNVGEATCLIKTDHVITCGFNKNTFAHSLWLKGTHKKIESLNFIYRWHNNVHLSNSETDLERFKQNNCDFGNGILKAIKSDYDLIFKKLIL